VFIIKEVNSKIWLYSWQRKYSAKVL